MRIFAKINSSTTKVVEVQPDEPVITLITKLNIADKMAKFVFRGMSYDIRSCKTFAEIGMKDKDKIFVNNEVKYAGGGGHICPYGCGRMIPDGYKGCTELLQERPNYFN